MLGALAGDIIGCPYEWQRIKTEDFPLFGPESAFTDDSVLTVATAYALLHDLDYAAAYKDFGRRYPGRGYGGRFHAWLASDSLEPYNSYGNGSAMRISPVGLWARSEAEALREAAASAAATHNHPEGIKGAQATALAMWLARQNTARADIRREISRQFGYDLSRTLAEIRPTYAFNEICQTTVPEALTAYFESDSVEDAIRKAVSLGGDSDTLACIAGGLAEAFYGPLPAVLAAETRQRLPTEFLEILDAFYARKPA